MSCCLTTTTSSSSSSGGGGGSHSHSALFNAPKADGVEAKDRLQVGICLPGVVRNLAPRKARVTHLKNTFTLDLKRATKERAKNKTGSWLFCAQMLPTDH